MGTNARVYSSMSKNRSGSFTSLVWKPGQTWTTKQLSWHAYCCLTGITVVTVKSRAHAKRLEASCHLAFPSQDEDYAWYLAQRGFLVLQLHPKS